MTTRHALDAVNHGMILLQGKYSIPFGLYIFKLSDGI